MLLPFCLMHMGFAGAGAVDQMFGNQLRLELVPVPTVIRIFDFTLWKITKPRWLHLTKCSVTNCAWSSSQS